MLYLVGGASRSGKSRLARRLLEWRRIAYFPIDALVMGLVKGRPEFGIDPDASVIGRGEKLWPIVRGIAVNLIEESLYHPDYLLEGDILLPRHAAELVESHPGEVRACFLGYTRASPEEILQAARRFEPEWARFYKDDRIVLAFLREQVDFSWYLQAGCARYGLAYFDVLDDFDGTIEAALRSLV